LLADEAEEVPAGLTPSKYCKIKKHLRGATLAVPTEKPRKQSARSSANGAGLSLKSQIMEQIFDLQEDAFATGATQGEESEGEAAAEEAPRLRLRGALAEVRRFNSSIRARPRNFSSRTI
jgi:hypothetical protein